MDGAQTPGHHVRCYPAKATEQYALLNKRGIEFINWEGGPEATTKHDWLRGTCRLGIIPAGGLLYTPPHGCNCYIETITRGMVAYNPWGGSNATPSTDTPRRSHCRARR